MIPSLLVLDVLDLAKHLKLIFFVRIVDVFKLKLLTIFVKITISLKDSDYTGDLF